MSRKITTEAVNAFLSGKVYSKANTRVSLQHNILGDKKTTATLSLHGNVIAKKKDNIISITNAGWQSNTTKERLNGIPGVRISQTKGKWYLNGVSWDGEWITI